MNRKPFARARGKKNRSLEGLLEEREVTLADSFARCVCFGGVGALSRTYRI